VTLRPGRLAAVDLTVPPGGEHALNALNAHAEVLPVLAEWTDDSLAAFGHKCGQSALPIPIEKATERPHRR
jgi:hypothetical protein